MTCLYDSEILNRPVDFYLYPEHNIEPDLDLSEMPQEDAVIDEIKDMYELINDLRF